MLRKLIRTALNPILLLRMSIHATALVPAGDTGIMLGFSTADYFGQYDSGADDTSAYYRSGAESKIKLPGMEEAFRSLH